MTPRLLLNCLIAAQGSIFPSLCFFPFPPSKKLILKSPISFIFVLSVFRMQDNGLNVTVWGREILVSLAHRKEILLVPTCKEYFSLPCLFVHIVTSAFLLRLGKNEATQGSWL
jgi:hypothetical protein